MRTVSVERSKWARTGGDTRAALMASNWASWSGLKVNGWPVRSRPSMGTAADAMSGKKSASWFTSP